MDWSWGSNGYGLEVSGSAEAAVAVGQLASMGAGVIKVPITAPSLTTEELDAVVAQAHARGLGVVAHALDDTAAAEGAAAGVDGLAHTPTSALSPLTIEAWKGRMVVSTLAAFGGAEQTIENLSALRDSGVEVLYGTDLGNTRDARIDPEELSLLQAAGLSNTEIIRAGTQAPAAYWGWSDLGVIEPGRRASLLVLDRDPLEDIVVLSDPEQVWIDGVLTRSR